jgi:hypothetical protein
MTEGQAPADENAQHPCQDVSIFQRRATPPSGVGSIFEMASNEFKEQR